MLTDNWPANRKASPQSARFTAALAPLGIILDFILIHYSKLLNEMK